VDVSKLLEKAREAAERRNYDYAIELYLQACKLSPDDAQARRELRAVENRMAKEKGTSFWAKAKTTALQAQIQGLMMAKKWDSAIEKSEEALKGDPGNVSLLMTLGRCCMNAGYKQSAIAIFEDIKTMGGGGNQKVLVEAMRELGWAYEADGKIQEALDAWQFVNKSVPGGDRDASVQIRNLSAKTMTKQIESAAVGGQRGAAARSTQTEQQKAEAARLDREKGMDIKTKDDLIAAINDCKADIAQRPDDARLYAKSGDFNKQGNDYDEAKKAYEQARAKDGNNPTWLFRLHDLEMWKMSNNLKALFAKVKAGDAGAREQYKKEHLAYLEYRLASFIDREKQYSTDGRIRFDLGCTYFDVAKEKNDKALYDQAIMRFQQTFRDPKYRNESGLRMGLGFAAKAQYELALKRFDETLAGLELKNEAWKNLVYAKADTFAKAGQKDDAKRCFLEIYEVDVSFKDVGKRIEELSSAQAAT